MAKPLIYASARLPSAKKSFSWFKTPQCVAKSLKPDLDYPNCTYFFHCLLTTSSDALDGLITKLGFIDRSTPLSDVSQLFRNISTAVKERKNLASFQLPRPLEKHPIFPIVRNERQDEFDYLAVLGSETSWYIADREHLRNSFRGKVPLLAFAVEELEAMEDVLGLFNVENRKLSTLVQTYTVPHGFVGVNKSYTAFLQERSEFFRA